ncbi:CHAD domain-containing protein [Falsirhodobacter sp. 1013]|uniref:CYTH and CHAD domain-containing protein n=1 Tax=Falsirhodobacter sp. 1013 TaxID=3417566 RepID=UPI003EBB94BC
MTQAKLRLHVSGEMAAQIMDGAGAAKSEQVHTVHFDTPDHALSAMKAFLRIRHLADRQVQTIRTPQGERDKLVEGDVPVVEASGPLGDILAHDLIPVFTTRHTRRHWSVEEAGQTVDVALDEGEIAAADRHVPIRDLVLTGAPSALVAVARRLAGNAQIAPLSKVERGYRLVGPAPLRLKATEVPLEATMTAAAAFQQITWSCLNQFRQNEDLLATRMAEPLHQARVALRRLRSAFSIFRPMLGDSGADLREGLRDLASELGQARDLDVLLLRAPQGPLGTRIRHAREAAHDAVAEVLVSDKTRGLLLDLAAWLHDGDWLRDEVRKTLREEPVTVFAQDALSRYRRKVKKGGKGLSTLEDEVRHDLRKDAKKLRYAAEFFSPLFAAEAPKRHRTFLGALETLQDHLGDLNDLATAPELLHRLGIRDEPGAADLLAKGRRKRLLREAEDAYDQLIDAKPFWA